MNSYNESDLIQLIAQTRKHLWMESTLRSINISLCISAALVITTAVTHLFSAWTNPYLLGSIVALFPLLLTTLYCSVFQRPSMQAASHAADKKLNANSLLLSAWELIQNPSNNSATTQLVIKQALTKIPKWRSQTKTELSMKLPRSSALAIAGILIGITMLSLPGGGQYLQSQSNVQFTSAQKTKPANPLADIIHSVSTLSKPTTDASALSNSSVNSVSEKSANKKVTTSNSTRDQELQSPLSSTDQISMDRATPTTSLQHSSGHPFKTEKEQHDTAGSSKAIADTKQSHTGTSALNVKTISIKRRATADGNSYSTSHQGVAIAGFNQPIKTDRRQPGVAAARVQKTQYSQGTFSLPQQHFIAQYFQQLHKGAEQ